ncbi:MAG: apolipoprotein N-acyltransferase [Chloroflexota bacterium]
MTLKRAYIAAAIGGASLALAFPPMPLFLLAFVGLAAILFAFDEAPRKKYWVLWLGFFFYHAGANWWISSWREQTDPYLMASGFALDLLHPFFFMVPFLGYSIAKRRLGRGAAIVAFPFLWTAFEYLHSLSDFSYPWLSVGATQIYNRAWIQFIDITGIWGASFLVALANSIIYIFLRQVKKRRDAADGIPLLDAAREAFKSSRANALLLIALVGIYAIPAAYGFYALPKYGYESVAVRSKESINIGLIQPAINPWQKWAGRGIYQINVHRHLQDSLKRAVPSLELAVWSETSIPYINLNINAYHEYDFLRHWLDTSRVSLLTGFSEFRFFDKKSAPPTARILFGDSNLIYEPYNAALMINAAPFGGGAPQIYRKSRLTPFAERFPHAEALTFAQHWFQWGVGISSWGKGDAQYNLEYIDSNKSASIAPVICIESIYPEFVSRFSRAGAGIIAIITNDAWYDYTIGPEQHYQLACLRAIENRKFVVRCANTGVTGFIAPNGTSVLRAPQYERTAIALTVPVMEGTSVYAVSRDAFAKLILAAALVIIGLSIYRKIQKREAK